MDSTSWLLVIQAEARSASLQTWPFPAVEGVHCLPAGELVAEEHPWVPTGVTLTALGAASATLSLASLSALPASPLLQERGYQVLASCELPVDLQVTLL